ncbi:hypothetical protein J2T57_001368 [Natronocella acetinitrilica]|uniref:Type IV pilus biogenesis protein PilP n=1 Tax=Natronocella acetinitrilica TaxID=414046 RepID=A0AAE3G1Z8_9GAMM|nr:hypothetical protein [Natronocella acetinitrilica]MCP1674266.1 hypothetical protein [Natronocella acetinitrilica]
MNTKTTKTVALALALAGALSIQAQASEPAGALSQIQSASKSERQSLELRSELSREVELLEMRLQLRAMQEEFDKIEREAATARAGDREKALVEHFEGYIAELDAHYQGVIADLEHRVQLARAEQSRSPVAIAERIATTRISGIGSAAIARFYYEGDVFTAAVGDEIAQGVRVADIGPRGATLRAGDRHVLSTLRPLEQARAEHQAREAADAYQRRLEAEESLARMRPPEPGPLPGEASADDFPYRAVYPMGGMQ